MDTSDISDDFSVWEDVQGPYDNQSPLSPSDVQQEEFRLELRENYYDDGSSIFPATEHEGLPVLITGSTASELDTLSVDSLSDTDSLTQRPGRADAKFSVIIRDIGTGISTAGGRMLKVLVTNFGCQISSIRRGSVVVPGVVLAVALFAFLKFLQWKNRLLALISEKDQRINQLMSQIVQMNEMLSARRKVPILRINYEGMKTLSNQNVLR